VDLEEGQSNLTFVFYQELNDNQRIWYNPSGGGGNFNVGPGTYEINVDSISLLRFE